MNRISSPRNVLDLYCGAQGRMYSLVWQYADLYLGVDKNTPHSLARTIKMSAERAVCSLDLDKYNVFDVDTYTTPWIVARKILKRRGEGRLGLVLTLGDKRGGTGHQSQVVRRLVGATNLSDYRLMMRYHDLIVKLLLRSLAELPGVRLLEGVEHETPSKIVYIALTIDISR